MLPQHRYTPRDQLQHWIRASRNFRPPLILFRESQYAYPHWIQVKVAGHRVQGRLVPNQHRLEPPLEHVPSPVVGPVEPDRKGGLEPVQYLTQVYPPTRDQQVIVVIHQNEGVDLRSKTLWQFGHQSEKSPTILVLRPPHPPCGRWLPRHSLG